MKLVTVVSIKLRNSNRSVLTWLATAVTLLFWILISGVCESDLEELESSQACVWRRLKGSELRQADLSCVSLWMTDLEQVQLEGANLT